MMDSVITKDVVGQSEKSLTISFSWYIKVWDLFC